MIKTSPTISSTSSTQMGEFVVLPGPEDVLMNVPDGLYQQSVTLIAQMHPPIEAGPRTIWGLPIIVWGIIVGCFIIIVIAILVLVFCCWLLPRRSKLLSPTLCPRNTSGLPNSSSSSIEFKQFGDKEHIVMPLAVGNSQFSTQPPPIPPLPSSSSMMTQSSGNHNYYAPQFCSSEFVNGGTNSYASYYTIKDHNTKRARENHKSLWAVNDFSSSSTVLAEVDSTYKSRSLPAWGKLKQRPVSTADDLEELYAKVNFSKKKRNRMRNDEAAIIAMCRSRSQNLPNGMPLDRDGIVVYDERTEL